MGQGFAPPPNMGNQGSSPVLGQNPNTYFNYMQLQDSGRMAQMQQNLPNNPNANEFSHQNLAGITPQQQPFNQLPNINPYMPQQMPSGLASLPGAGQYGKGIV